MPVASSGGEDPRYLRELFKKVAVEREALCVYCNKPVGKNHSCWNIKPPIKRYYSGGM